MHNVNYRVYNKNKRKLHSDLLSKMKTPKHIEACYIICSAMFLGNRVDELGNDPQALKEKLNENYIANQKIYKHTPHDFKHIFYICLVGPLFFTNAQIFTSIVFADN